MVLTALSEHHSFHVLMQEDSYQSKIILDSGTVVVEDQFNNDPERILDGTLRITIPSGKSYVLEVELYDINRMQDHLEFLVIDKNNKHEHTRELKTTK